LPLLHELRKPVVPVPIMPAAPATAEVLRNLLLVKLFSLFI